jgi:glutathione S-transferase
MELRFALLSPYARKVRVVAHEVGVADRIRMTEVNVREEPESIVAFNPLGKIPALVLDDGSVLYDSPVICEYLDSEFGGGRLLAASGDKRWRTLTRAALVDGALDAAILARNERLRPAEKQSQEWIDWQLGKMLRALDTLEKEAASFGDGLDLGLVAVGCAVGYLPVRVPEAKDPARWPRLAQWYTKIVQRPSFAKTVPVV